MVTPSTSKTHLTHLSTHWQNKSLSSLSAASEAGTFHTTHTNLEMRPLSRNQNKTTHPNPHIQAQPPSDIQSQAQEPASIKMNRTDSGYSSTIPASEKKRRESPISSRRTSTSSRQRTGSPSNPVPNPPRRSTTTRPLIKRASITAPLPANVVTGRKSTSNGRSSLDHTRTSTSTRPSFQTRRTTTAPTTVTTCTSNHRPQTPYTFFQFPTPPTPPEAPPKSLTPIPQPPPATVQYWTSDSTRRLEYAAIDAASKGVKGWLIKLVPDCMIPADAKRMGFHEEGGDMDSDAGSVRRYRLVLPEEKGSTCGGDGQAKPSLLRRWTSFGWKN